MQHVLYEQKGSLNPLPHIRVWGGDPCSQKLHNALGARCNVGRTLSQVFSRERGFLQGYSGSVQVALAFMSKWTASVKARSPEPNILRTGSFIDDCHCLAKSASCRQVVKASVDAWKSSLEFDSLRGLRTNFCKSLLFANIPRVKQAMGPIPGLWVHRRESTLTRHRLPMIHRLPENTVVYIYIYRLYLRTRGPRSRT